MPNARKYDEKFTELETLIIEDYNNGRHLKHKVEQKLTASGKCPQSLKLQLKQIQDNSEQEEKA